MKHLHLWIFTAAAIAAVLAGAYMPAASAQEVRNEDTLIATLQAPESDWMAKQDACRGLRITGTKKAVPALAALLPDEKLSHIARYALEAIPGAEASEALRNAVGTTSGLTRQGIIGSLGERRDAKAVPVLLPLLSDADPGTAAAAAGALGRIGTADSVDAALAAAKTASGPVQLAALEGVLAGAERLSGTGNNMRVAGYYTALLDPSYPAQIRMGAFRGLIEAQAAQAWPRLIVALAGPDDNLRNLAAQLVSETKGSQQIREFGETLPVLPPAGQIALLRGLALKGDPAARNATAAMLAVSDKQVRLAAIAALARLGNDKDARTLAGYLDGDDADIAGAAQGALAKLDAKGVNEALAASFAGAAPAAREKLLRLLTDRGAAQALPTASNALKDEDSAVRVTALRVFGMLAGTSELPAVIEVAVAPPDDAARTAAESALTDICSRAKNEALAGLSAAMNNATSDARRTLLRALPAVATPEALAMLTPAVADADAGVKEEALRLLSDWPTMDAAPQLLELAKDADEGKYVLGMRGYVRLARAENDPARKTDMLNQAMSLARRVEEKKMIIGAWGTLKTASTLDVLKPLLDNAEVCDEAAATILGIAADLAKKDPNAKPIAAEVVKLVLEKNQNDAIKENANRLAGQVQ